MVSTATARPAASHAIDTSKTRAYLDTSDFGSPAPNFLVYSIKKVKLHMLFSIAELILG